jgi:glutathione S-transferase
VAHESDFDLSQFPALRGWLKRVARQPNYVPMDWHPATAAAE